MKEKLELLVKEMHDSGIDYPDAIREFEKRFLLNVINHRTIRGNQCKAAKTLKMHRNTFSRATRELSLQRGKHGLWGVRSLAASSKPVQPAVIPAAAEIRQA